MPAEEQPIKSTWQIKLLKVRVWVSERVQPSELQVMLFWAGVIGFAGGVSSVVFRKLSQGMHWVFTGQTGGLVETFEHLVWWQRLIVPAIGGGLAGFTLYLGTRISSRKSSTDYMEAIALGDGIVPARLSLVKCLSAMFTIASGGSIGREGPLVQLAAMLASLLGRVRKIPTLQLRLLVACGAAAGIASAYNAPIGGAMFVAEIVLCSMAMETFGPLVFSSVVATLTVRNFLGSDPLYEIQMPGVRLNSNWEIIPYLFLGITAGLAAPWFLRLLRVSETLFSKLTLPRFARMTLGGLAVGVLAIFYPETCGNGYSVVNGILHGHYLWYGLLLILVFKLAGTAATFGSGAVGGVFTPTLFTGACLG
ncbi:MAG TPA: chloride channel protein, partial [Chthoniobacteraceae bacterium]|nr:chloride channel protein [Chthoniobacteraceae bacterium]